MRYAEAEIARVASEIHLDKELVKKALKAANKAQRGSDEFDEEKQQDAMWVWGLNADTDIILLKTVFGSGKVIR